MKDVLIVEDGRQEQQRLQRLAEDLQLRVTAVSSVEEGSAEIQKERYRLVLLDLGLEDQNGLHLFREIKKLPYAPKVVVLTGNPSTHLKQRFLDDDAFAYIYKGSEAASNDSLTEVLKAAVSQAASPDSQRYRELGLREFLRDFVTPASRELFYQHGEQLPSCAVCASTEFTVVFSHRTQLPPLIEGKVCCGKCGSLLDFELG